MIDTTKVILALRTLSQGSGGLWLVDLASCLEASPEMARTADGAHTRRYWEKSTVELRSWYTMLPTVLMYLHQKRFALIDLGVNIVMV